MSRELFVPEQGGEPLHHYASRTEGSARALMEDTDEPVGSYVVTRYTPSSGLSTEEIVERAFEVYLRTEKFAVATAIRHALKLARGEPTDD